MTIHLGNVPASSTLYIPFATYGKTNGESITMSGFATSDIKIYKNGSTTERAFTNGYTLLDTDGTDFDGVTGLQGFSVDLSDNTDAGFYSVGGFYWVIVSTVTIDAQVVTLIAATFRIVAAEGVTGKPKVDVDAFGGSAGTFASGRPEVNTTHIAGSAVSTSSAQIGVNVVQLNADATSAANIAKTTRAIARGTVGNASSTTSIVTSAFTPSGAAADQFKGRIVTFDATTATAALQGQATDITASSNAATPTLTVTALTTAPASGDTFSVT